MGTFVVRGPLPVIEALETAVTTLAHRLQDHLPISTQGLSSVAQGAAVLPHCSHNKGSIISER